MIDISYNRLLRGDHVEEPIQKWVVWWKTPFGLCETSYEAVKACKEKNLDPDLAVVPVAVAIGQTTHEVWDR